MKNLKSARFWSGSQFSLSVRKRSVVPCGCSRKWQGGSVGYIRWVVRTGWAALGTCLQHFCCSETPKTKPLAQALSAWLFWVAFQQPPHLWQPLHSSARLICWAGAVCFPAGGAGREKGNGTYFLSLFLLPGAAAVVAMLMLQKGKWEVKYTLGSVFFGKVLFFVRLPKLSYKGVTGLPFFTLHLFFRIFLPAYVVLLDDVQPNFEISPYKCCFDYAKPISELK